MTEIRTGFNPTSHGFQFTNRFPGGAVVAELARQDRLSELTGLSVPRAVRNLTDLASGASFWGTFGLCGGMSSGALARFQRGEAVPNVRSIPEPNSVLFQELVKRQADTLHGRKVMERCLTCQLLPDRAPFWMFWTKGVARMTVEEEWPTLRAALQAGSPTLLCLIRVKDIASPADNHQVVAFGADVESNGRVVVQIYDPNHPRATPTFSLDIRRQTVGPNQSTGETVRGFFI